MNSNKLPRWELRRGEGRIEKESSTYVVSGHAETKKLQDLLPGIINQLGPDNLANLKKIAES